MLNQWQTVSGTIAQGYRVASGLTEKTPYPDGALALQLPHFLARGFDLRPYFLGTLNIAITPYEFRMVKPDITLEQVAWTDAHGPETFSFSRCQLTWHTQTLSGWIYYPHPETKPMHQHQPDVIEALMPTIDGIAYGDRVELSVLTTAIQIVPGSGSSQPY